MRKEASVEGGMTAVLNKRVKPDSSHVQLLLSFESQHPPPAKKKKKPHKEKGGTYRSKDLRGRLCVHVLRHV